MTQKNLEIPEHLAQPFLELIEHLVNIGALSSHTSIECDEGRMLSVDIEIMVTAKGSNRVQ